MCYQINYGINYSAQVLNSASALPSEIIKSWCGLHVQLSENTPSTADLARRCAAT